MKRSQAHSQDGGEGLFGMEGREHTAQVDQERREWREWRFRWGKEDQDLLAEAKEDLRQAGEPDDFLPVLFCSPTMEIGRRHFRVERGLSAQCPANASELCATFRARWALGPGGAGNHLLLGARARMTNITSTDPSRWFAAL